jgi:ribose transport system substrate-binding protein
MVAKRVFPVFLAVVVIATMLGSSAQAQTAVAPSRGAVYQSGTPTATLPPEAQDNPYLQSLLRREQEVYDTTKFKKDPPYKLALASQGPTNSWATLFDAHARWEVSKLGTDVVSELLYADANGSADKQVPQVEDLLSQNPDALILVPMGRAALSAPVERVMAAGVPVILCASGVDTDDFVTEIGTNLFRSGQVWAQFVVDQLGGKGNVVQMNGIPGVDTAETEAKGAASVWAKNPGIKVLDVQPGNWSTSDAKKLMEQWIAKYGTQIDGIWSGGAQMNEGIIQAYLDAKLPIPPMGGGEYMNGFLRMAAENNVKFQAVQYPPSMSVLCVDTAVKILRGEPVARYLDFRDFIKETRDFTNADIKDFYNPKWSDDVFGPVFIPDEELAKLGYLKQ